MQRHINNDAIMMSAFPTSNESKQGSIISQEQECPGLAVDAFSERIEPLH